MGGDRQRGIIVPSLGLIHVGDDTVEQGARADKMVRLLTQITSATICSYQGTDGEVCILGKIEFTDIEGCRISIGDGANRTIASRTAIGKFLGSRGSGESAQSNRCSTQDDVV